MGRASQSVTVFLRAFSVVLGLVGAGCPPAPDVRTPSGVVGDALEREMRSKGYTPLKVPMGTAALDAGTMLNAEGDPLGNLFSMCELGNTPKEASAGLAQSYYSSSVDVGLEANVLVVTAEGGTNSASESSVRYGSPKVRLIDEHEITRALSTPECVQRLPKNATDLTVVRMALVASIDIKAKESVSGSGGAGVKYMTFGALGRVAVKQIGEETLTTVDPVVIGYKAVKYPINRTRVVRGVEIDRWKFHVVGMSLPLPNEAPGMKKEDIEKRRKRGDREYIVKLSAPAEALELIKSVTYHRNHPTVTERETRSTSAQTGFQVDWWQWGCIPATATTGCEARVEFDDGSKMTVPFDQCGVTVAYADRGPSAPSRGCTCQVDGSAWTQGTGPRPVVCKNFDPGKPATLHLYGRISPHNPTNGGGDLNPRRVKVLMPWGTKSSTPELVWRHDEPDLTVELNATGILDAGDPPDLQLDVCRWAYQTTCTPKLDITCYQ